MTDNPLRKGENMKKKAVLYTVIGILTFVCAFAVIATEVNAGKKTCAKTGCKSTAIEGGQYCSAHTCTASGCRNLRYSDKTTYCYSHRCMFNSCSSKREDGTDFCRAHQKAGEEAYAKMREKNNSKSKGKGKTSGSSGKSSSSGKGTKDKKKYDPYDVYDYSSARDFAEDKYEEFYDYEDDYEDEDEAYDAAEDYWREHHRK